MRPRARWTGPPTLLLALALLGCATEYGDLAPAGLPDQRTAEPPADWPRATLLPVVDRWSKAAPRWADLAGVAYAPAFVAARSSTGGLIELAWDPTPDQPTLVGAIRASGLKPNFCYQLKLMGKPGSARGGLWGVAGNRQVNEILGRAGRWWNFYGEQGVLDNFTNDTQYARLSDEAKDWVAGYLFFGVFVTDEHGATDHDGDGSADWTPLTANRSYHITGRSGQETRVGEAPGSRFGYSLRRTGSALRPAPYPADLLATDRTASGSLWFEPERDDPVDFPGLPAAAEPYELVLVVTEETFHDRGPAAGCWLTVFATDWPGAEGGAAVQFRVGATAPRR